MLCNSGSDAWIHTVCDILTNVVLLKAAQPSMGQTSPLSLSQ